ncbi:MAG TPA: ABC transporter permease subunit [Candidatus Sulfomarinibacteraceae bacterium]|nr:ABC transporter permease subunit [Candidatus Sulfomarinibacteraceae bacterium]
MTSPSVRVRRRPTFAWVGVVPFFLFAFAALGLPVGFLVIGSFQNADGDLTLQNFADLTTGTIPRAFLNSIEISLVTALAGGIFGFLLAWAVIMGGLPGWIRSAVMTFSGVASNFAGVPLALAFVFTIGNLGLLTKFFLEQPPYWCQALGLATDCSTWPFAASPKGISLRQDLGFTIYSKTGLEIVYLYFQFPLMVLIIAPALDGLRREWREASENLGASAFQYWRHVALPILAPSILGTMILLFGNAFGAQATAFQLTGGTIEIVTIAIGRQIRGDVLHNPGLGYAMAMGMVVIMAFSITVYTLLQRRSERWLRS